MSFSKAYREYDKEVNLELSNTGIFYAFSKEQFNQNKPKKDASDTEYLSVGYGAYIHKKDKSKLDKYFNEIAPRLRQELVSKVNIEDFIHYELINHDCYYTGDYTEILEVLRPFYKDISDADMLDKIKDVYYKHKDSKEG